MRKAANVKDSRFLFVLDDRNLVAISLNWNVTVVGIAVVHWSCRWRLWPLVALIVLQCSKIIIQSTKQRFKSASPTTHLCCLVSLVECAHTPWLPPPWIGANAPCPTALKKPYVDLPAPWWQHVEVQYLGGASSKQILYSALVSSNAISLVALS